MKKAPKKIVNAPQTKPVKEAAVKQKANVAKGQIAEMATESGDRPEHKPVNG